MVLDCVSLPPESHASSPLHVLVIEDDVDTRELLRDLLELDNYVVSTAGSLKEALARDDWHTIGAVILDRRLPDGSAEKLLPQLRQLAPDAAVIVVTGFADLNHAIVALQHGAVDYLLKPINPEALRARLKGISQHRHTQESLRQERQFSERLIEQAPAIVLVLDPQGRIVRFNPYMERLSGYALSELQGKDWFTSLIPPDEQARIREFFSKVIDAGEREHVNSIITKNGQLREIQWSNGTLQNTSGQTIAVLAIGQDITELRAAQQRVLQSERLAAIGQMVTGLAHESRNALQRTQACLEMLELEIGNNPTAQDLVARIQKSQDQLHRLFDEVRSYAGPIRLEISDCHLGEVWREAWELLSARHSARTVTLTEHTEGVDLRCRADRFRLVQVFRNLLENSLAASGDPVQIDIFAGSVLLNGRPAVQITVRDNGPGLNAEQRRRIFEPFFTTKTQGTGLGMAIAERVIKSHGGQIAVGEKAGPGAEIVLTLPRE